MLYFPLRFSDFLWKMRRLLSDLLGPPKHLLISLWDSNVGYYPLMDKVNIPSTFRICTFFDYFFFHYYFFYRLAV